MTDFRIPAALFFLSLLSATAVSGSIHKISSLSDFQRTVSRDVGKYGMPRSEPDYDRPFYIIEDNHYRPCFLASMNITTTVTYPTTGGNNKTATVPVPSYVFYDGACENHTIDDKQGPRLELYWRFNRSISDQYHSLNIQFNVTDEEIFIEYVDLKFNPNDTEAFPDILDTYDISTVVPVNDYHNKLKSESFRCDSEKEFFNEGDSVKFEDVKFEIGKDLPNSFGWGRQCTDDWIKYNTPSYVLENEEGICILANMEMSFNITYENEQGENQLAIIEVPKNATVNGTCGDSVLNGSPDPQLSLTWWWDSADSLQDNPHTVTVNFTVSDPELYIYEVKGLFNPNDTNAFPQITDTSSGINFVAPVNDYHLADDSQSLTCSQEKEFHDAAIPDQLSMTLKNVRFQVGRNMSERFTQGPACTKPSTNNKDPSFIINNGESNCLLARMDITVAVPYVSEQGENKTTVVKVPDNALYVGACVDNSINTIPGPVLIIEWKWNETISETEVHTLKIYFKSVDDKIYIEKVLGSFNPNDNNTFPNANLTTGSSLPFDVTVDNYYLIDTSKSLTCESEHVFYKNGKQEAIRLKNVQIEFGKNLPETFGPGSVCKDDHNAPAYVLHDEISPCFLATMNISFNVPYQTTSGLTFATTVRVPENAPFYGYCSAKSQETGLAFQWRWDSSDEEGQFHVSQITFREDSNGLYMSSVSTSLNPNDTTIFPDIEDTRFRILGIFDVNDYRLADKSESLTCDSKRVFPSRDDKVFTVSIEDLQFQSGQDLTGIFTPGPNCPPLSNDLPPFSTPPPEIDGDKPSYVINDGQNPCLMASMDISFDISYLTDFLDLANSKLDIPEHATFSGACEGEHYGDILGPVIVLEWMWSAAKDNHHAKSSGNHKAKVRFYASPEGTYILSVEAELDINDYFTFPNIDKYRYPAGVMSIAIPVNDYKLTEDSESFTCNSGKNFADDSDSNFHVELKNVKFQMGKNINDTDKFASGASCSDDDDDNTVAIAVGVTVPLVAIIVIGGIVYWKFWK